jgi:GWxTD domain-containing protein
MKHWAFCLGLGWGLFASVLQAQPEAPFAIEAVHTVAPAPPGQTRIELYVQVPYPTLQFLRIDDGFRATYALLAEVYRVEAGDRLRFFARESWQRTVTTVDFEATQSPESTDLSTRAFTLPPGRYRVVVQLEDQATQRLITRTLELQVRSLAGPVALSDPLLLKEYTPGRQQLVPYVGAVEAIDSRTLPVFYELAARQRQKGRVVYELLHLEQSRGWPVVGPLLGLGREETYVLQDQQVEVLTLPAGRTARVYPFVLKEALKNGSYLLRMRIIAENGELLAAVEKPFTVFWNPLMAYVQDLDVAIDQLRYIAKAKELAYIRAGKTPEQRWQRFLEFWKKRDPTPGTPRNEQMEEYYTRIALANRKFSGQQPGWQTDRGHIVVLFGEPDFIEHRSGTQPYEIWHYRRLGRRFIFVDQTGKGDYKLLEPVWDERSRIR